MQVIFALLKVKHYRNFFILLLLLSGLLGLGQVFQSEILFDRNRIEQGYWWQLVSGNFTHSNIPHLLLNLSGLWVLFLLFFDSLKATTFSISILLLSPFVGLGLYLYNPELHFYYGFSGVLYGLYFIAATAAVLKKEYFTGFAVAFIISGKIIWDAITGGNQASAELIGVPVANDSHLYGYLGSLLIATFLIIRHLFSKPEKEPSSPLE